MLSAQKQYKIKSGASKELKKIFTLSGAIRDVQLQQWLVTAATKKTSPKPKAYFNFLQQQNASLKTTLLQLPIKKIIAGSKAAVNKSLPHKYSTAKFKAYFKTQKAAAWAIIAAGHFSDEQLHRIRKILKDLYYNLIVYQKYSSLKKDSRLKETTEHYEELIKALGIFHDKCIAISLLPRSYQKQTEKFVLQQIKKNWQKEKQLMKKELVKLLTSHHLLEV
jgi:CHAD domain-containing protein